MNSQEYYSSTNRRNEYYKYVHKLLKDWKIKNNIPTEKTCVAHHRDDNDEVRMYNESHYELWGFNEDGSFEYGKYIVFMLNTDHVAHHHKGKDLPAETKEKISAANKGKNNPMYGRNHSAETKEKLSNLNKGKNHSAETKEKLRVLSKGRKLSTEAKEKISVANKGRKLSTEAKEHLSAINKGENHPMYGKKRSAETREKMSECKVGANNPMYGKPLSTETKEKLSVSLKTYLASLKFLYCTYKNNGGSKKWNDFKRALKTGDITFSDYKITVMNDTHKESK